MTKRCLETPWKEAWAINPLAIALKKHIDHS